MQNENRDSSDIYCSDTRLASVLSHANILMESGKYNEACHSLETLLRRREESLCIPAYWYLGWAHAFNKEWDSAIHIFDRVTRLAPEQPESFLYLGEMYRCRGDLGGACEMWWEGLTLAWQKENHLAVQIAAAFLASAQAVSSGKQDEIIQQHLALAINSPGWTDDTIHHSQIPFMLSLIGNLALLSRQYYTAAWLLRGKTEDNGGFASDAYQLACAEEYLGNRREAARAYELTLQKEPGHRKARKALFRIQLRRLDLVSAAYHFALLSFCRR